jgi:hypothetical protein
MISDAPGSNAGIGVVIWGLGLAEVKTARRLVRQGVPCMQIRLSSDDENVLKRLRHDDYRAAVCQLAMDHFAAARGIDAFVLLGNCTLANVCFIAATGSPPDPRVVGLIMANPYVGTDSVLLRQTIAREPSQSAETQAARLFGSTPLDPERFNEALRELSARNVNVLIVGGVGDPIFRGFCIACGDTLRELTVNGNVTFEQFETDTHIFSSNDHAATLFTESVSKWMHTSRFQTPHAAP